MRTIRQLTENEIAFLFLPAGVFLGVGFGLLVDDVPFGILTGLGIALSIYAVLDFLRLK